jgi:hypothetical protein
MQKQPQGTAVFHGKVAKIYSYFYSLLLMPNYLSKYTFSIETFA